MISHVAIRFDGVIEPYTVMKKYVRSAVRAALMKFFGLGIGFSCIEPEGGGSQ